MRSSQRRRCRSSRSASWPVLVPLAKQVKRCPSRSVNRSWGAGVRAFLADDHGHAHRVVQAGPRAGQPGREVMGPPPEPVRISTRRRCSWASANRWPRYGRRQCRTPRCPGAARWPAVPCAVRAAVGEDGHMCQSLRSQCNRLRGGNFANRSRTTAANKAIATTHGRCRTWQPRKYRQVGGGAHGRVQESAKLI
jgi:hypothetical protein